MRRGWGWYKFYHPAYYSFQIIDNPFLCAVCIAFVIVTQLEQFVFSFFGCKIQSEVS